MTKRLISPTATVVTLFVFSVMLIFILARQVQQKTYESWYKEVVNNQQEMSRVLAYWLDLEVAELRGIAATFYASDSVSRDEFQTLSSYFQLHHRYNSSNFSIAVITEDLNNSFSVYAAPTPTRSLYQGMDVAENEPLLESVLTALSTSNEIYIGPIHKNLDGEMVAYAVTLAPNQEQSGLVVYQIYMDTILDGLMRIFDTEGLAITLNTSHLFESPAITLGNYQADKLAFTTEQIFYHSGADWSMKWQVHENYLGGPNLRFADTVFFFGLTIVTLASLMFYFLVNRNKQVNNLVKERTIELEQANVILQHTQNELVQTEKLASLGSLVAGVSHELNTPLGTMITCNSAFHAELTELQQLMDSGQLTKNKMVTWMGNTKENQQLMASNLDRAANLVRNFKQMSVEYDDQDVSSFRLKDLVVGIISQNQHQLLNQSIKTKVNIGSDVKLRCHLPSLEQAISRLMTNAMLHAFHQPTQPAEISFDYSFDSHHKFSISDNGSGIKEEHLGKIFDPFFTTTLGQGSSGLGLNIVYNLVTRALSGDIEVSSEVGSGTSFTMTFADKNPDQVS